MAPAAALKKIRDDARRHVSRKRGVSNTFLNRLCRLAATGPSFYGVHSADYIPPRLGARARFIFIVNLGTRRGVRGRLPVGHFVAVVGFSDSVLYLDSYGLPCVQRNVLEFLRTCRRPVYFNRLQIQSYDSAHCGFYAALFALYFDGEYKFRMRFDKKRLFDNDKKCFAYLYRILEN